MQVDLRILRYDPERDPAPHWEAYRVEAAPMDRVLNLLKTVRQQQRLAREVRDHDPRAGERHVILRNDVVRQAAACGLGLVCRGLGNVSHTDRPLRRRILPSSTSGQPNSRRIHGRSSSQANRAISSS